MEDAILPAEIIPGRTLEAEFDHRLAAAEAFAAAANWQAAERELTAALALEPTSVRALARMSDCQMKLGRVERATALVDEVIAAAPNDPAGYRLKAIQQLNARSPQSAIAAAEEAVRLDPDDAANQHVLAAAHVQRKAWKEAMAAATRSRDLAPDWSVAMAQQAIIMLEMKGGKAAQPFMDEAIEAGGLENDYVLLQAGTIALARGRLAEAGDLLGELLRRNPEDESALSLYLMTDRKRHGLMRSNFRRRYWRREHGSWGWLAWGCGWTLVIAAIIPLAILTNVPGFAVVLVYRGYERLRYSAHRKEVRAHFRQVALKSGY